MSTPHTKDWPMVPLGKLITDTRNGLYKPDTFYGSGVPILKMFNIGRLDGTWNLANVDRVRLTKEEHALFRLDAGDLLVNRVNSRELVGKCAVVDESTDGAVFESKNLRLRADRGRVLPEWIAYWLNGEGGRNQIEDKAKQAIGQATINRGDLDAISIPLPPLAEQRMLAGELREKLAAVAEARAALQSQIKAAAALPAAYLREVFEGDALSASEKKPLRQIASFRHGGTPSKGNHAFWLGSIPWVSPKDMHCDIVKDTEDHISAAAIAASATSLIPSGSLLVVIRSGILVRRLPVAIAGKEVAFNQDIKAILPDAEQIHSPFLFHALRAQEARFLCEGVKKGGTVHSVKSGFLETLPIPLPPLPEQRAIAARLDGLLSGVADLRGALEARLASVERLPGALLREVFGAG